MSQQRRKRVEEIFGWLKTVGLMRKTRHRLEISTATTIRHSQPAELDLVEQGGRLRPRGPTRPLTLWTSPQLSPRPAVVASVTVVSGFRDAFPAPGNVAAKRCAREKRAF